MNTWKTNSTPSHGGERNGMVVEGCMVSVLFGNHGRDQPGSSLWNKIEVT